MVQVRAGPPLVADGLLGHEVVGDQRGLPVPPAEDLDPIASNRIESNRGVT